MCVCSCGSMPDATPCDNSQKAKATTFKHQDLSNNSPGTLKTSVSGSKKSSKSVTMTFTGYGCHFNPCQVRAHKRPPPQDRHKQCVGRVACTCTFSTVRAQVTLFRRRPLCPLTYQRLQKCLRRCKSPRYAHASNTHMLNTANKVHIYCQLLPGLYICLWLDPLLDHGGGGDPHVRTHTSHPPRRHHGPAQGDCGGHRSPFYAYHCGYDVGYGERCRGAVHCSNEHHCV